MFIRPRTTHNERSYDKISTNRMVMLILNGWQCEDG